MLHSCYPCDTPSVDERCYQDVPGKGRVPHKEPGAAARNRASTAGESTNHRRDDPACKSLLIRVNRSQPLVQRTPLTSSTAFLYHLDRKRGPSSRPQQVEAQDQPRQQLPSDHLSMSCTSRILVTTARIRSPTKLCSDMAHIEKSQPFFQDMLARRHSQSRILIFNFYFYFYFWRC